MTITEALRVERSATDHVVTGVVGGWAARYRVDATTARLMLVVLAFAGGVGVALYVVAWGCSRQATTLVSPGTTSATGRRLGESGMRAPGTVGSADRTAPSSSVASSRLVTQRSLAVALMTGAMLITLRRVGWWPGDALMVPVAVVGSATAALWFGEGVRRVDPLARLTGGGLRPVRLIAGGLLAIAGIAVLTAKDGLRGAPRATAAIGLTVAGLAAVAAPVLWQLFARLREEQRDRIRSEERAEVATHLHDSVLQTLALMQRSSDDPRRMVILARRQERELRTWLYGEQQAAGYATVNGAFAAMAAAVELDHELAVELVTVGDGPMTDTAESLLGAVREAVINVARHAKVESVAVYVEVAADGVFASVRDTGCGFDQAMVAADDAAEHHGITDSIRSRLARFGGSASLDTEPGVGTEWELRVPPGTPLTPTPPTPLAPTAATNADAGAVWPAPVLRPEAP